MGGIPDTLRRKVLLSVQGCTCAVRGHQKHQSHPTKLESVPGNNIQYRPRDNVPEDISDSRGTANCRTALNSMVSKKRPQYQQHSAPAVARSRSQSQSFIKPADRQVHLYYARHDLQARWRDMESVGASDATHRACVFDALPQFIISTKRFM
jgi:hypothetical protein